MSQQENETNKHLARFYAAISSGISDKKYKIIRNILKHNNCLNSLIPETPYFRQEKPHLIGNSLLHLALMEHEQKIFNFLIDQGADFTLKNSNGETVLHQAFRQSNKSQKPCDIIWGKIIHPFIDSGLTAQVNSRNWSNPSNKHGLTHFHIACMVNHTAAVKFFLENDVSVNETVDMDSPSLPGYSALQFAVRYYAYEVVLILLNYGADTSLKDASGTNPLQLVVKRNIDIAEWLQSGNHTLDKLFKKELEANEKVIAAILGPPGFDDTGSLGFNALHAACTLSDSSTVEELLRLDYDPEQAVDVRSPIFPGYRPLHFAAHFNTRTIKLLLDAGADPTREDATGRSALDICMTRDDVSDSMPMLLSSRPDWANISFSDGVTSLQKFVLSTRLCLSLLSFLEHVDIDVHLPLDSPLWPGCGVLHLCVLFAANEDNVPDIRTSIDLPNINCWLSPNGPLWIEHCLRHGADIYAPDARGLSPLQLAFRLGKHYLITYLLHTQPCFQADPGMSRLLLGCLYGDAKFPARPGRQIGQG
ncbi:ankyrin-3-like [Phymastichus coffea]|uniref:ankyrin-3-like n=1 Tax=Phymastichus coffea TaxID=108790 RepID=UPI00273B8B3C|nr:ankyrin-3-like [Phymastichus coffea]